MKQHMTKFIAALLVGMALLGSSEAAFARAAPPDTLGGGCPRPMCGAPPDTLRVPTRSY